MTDEIEKPRRKPKQGLVRMVRQDGKTADVHPSMESEYAKGGYVRAKGASNDNHR